jgi:hypothetical protein
MDSRMKYGTVLALVMLAGATVSAADDSLFQKWAIVPTQEVSDKGIPDLVLAAMSGVTNMIWLERAQLGDIDRVLVKDSFYAAGASGRVEMGRRLGADVLVMLSFVQGGNFLECAVVESRYGSRLSYRVLDSSKQTPAQLAEQIRLQVVGAREKAARGIRLVVLLLPFAGNMGDEPGTVDVSPELILEANLLDAPHTAVVETRHAPNLRMERATGGSTESAGTRWLFLEGRCTNRVGSAGQNTVDFEITLTDRKEYRRTWQATATTAHDLERHLTLEVPREVVRQALAAHAGGTLPDEESRLAALTAAADACERMNDLDQAAGLREAALLIRPNDMEQRRKLADTYAKLAQNGIEMTFTVYQKLASANLLQDRYLHGISRWYRMLEQLEYLVRNRAVDGEYMVRKQWNVQVGFRYSEIGIRNRTSVEEAKKDYLLNVYPLILYLPKVIYGNWHLRLFEQALMRYDWKPWQAEDCEFLYELLERVAPIAETEQRISRQGQDGRDRYSGLERFLAKPWIEGTNDVEVVKTAYVAMLERLERSRHPMNRMYATSGMLAWKRNTGTLTPADKADESLMPRFWAKFLGAQPAPYSTNAPACAGLTPAETAALVEPSARLSEALVPITQRRPLFTKREAYLAMFDRYWPIFTAGRYAEADDFLEHLLFEDVWERIRNRPEEERLHFLLYCAHREMDFGPVFVGNRPNHADAALKGMPPSAVLERAKATFWPVEVRPFRRDGAYQWAIVANKPVDQSPDSILQLSSDGKTMPFLYLYNGGFRNSQLTSMMK